MINAIDHLLYFLAGLPTGSGERRGTWSLQFHPAWPGQAVLGASLWNVLLMAAIGFVLARVYRRGRAPVRVRVCLAALRGLSLLTLLILLNRPELGIVQSRVEPSVLAIMVDDSLSMSVPDAGTDAVPQSRLSAVQSLLVARGGPLLAELSRKHQLKLYRFDRDAAALPAAASVADLKPDSAATQVAASVATVAADLQGQRVAGIVVLTDGRDTPAPIAPADLDHLKSAGVKVFPVAVGSDRPPKNIEVQSVQADDVAFSGDAVNVTAVVRATGFEPNHVVRLVLKDKQTGKVLTSPDGKPAEAAVVVPGEQPVTAELQWQTSDVGEKRISFEAVAEPGEVDPSDNARDAVVDVVESKITVLFVDGYPRWDYRYLKNVMLRDKSISVSCLLASADFNFLQEGNKPLPTSGGVGRFPDTLDELMQYDVLVLGDADPGYFSSSQLQLINEFVARGGGFIMVAGSRWSPQAYRNTPVEAVLPVSIAHVEPTDPNVPIQDAFRPLVTRAGDALGFFHFFADRAANVQYLTDRLPGLFWFSRGVTAKPGVGEVLAEHPTVSGPDGRRTPLLVAGRFGGRTLFSGFDDSWRWRFFTGESIFDSYWIRQLRYVARGRKLTQRRITLSADQPQYELGSRVHLNLRVIDPGLLHELPDEVQVRLTDSAGQPVGAPNLTRREGSDVFEGSFSADCVGRYTVQVPLLAAGVDPVATSYEVIVPRLELEDARVDHLSLDRLAAETLGKPIEFAHAAEQMLAIPSAEREIPQASARPLWDTPGVMTLLAMLFCGEWVLRKRAGMV